MVDKIFRSYLAEATSLNIDIDVEIKNTKWVHLNHSTLLISVEEILPPNLEEANQDFALGEKINFVIAFPHLVP